MFAIAPCKSYFAATAIACLVLGASPDVFAQVNTTPHAPNNSESTENTNLVAELHALRGKVAALEVALEEQHRERYGSQTSSSDSPAQSMKSMGGMGMGMMNGKGDMQGMSQSSDGSSQGMSMGMMDGGMSGMGMMTRGKMGMGMMGRNPAMTASSMSGMSMPSALPGFPGASHIYHIGETGFFLDHPQHITLADEQQQQLNEIKEAALLAVATAERKIEEAEQELWKLTAEASPTVEQIEAKVKEIAQVRAESRIAFIRSVGQAAGVLTQEQRLALIGEVKQ